MDEQDKVQGEEVLRAGSETVAQGSPFAEAESTSGGGEMAIRAIAEEAGGGPDDLNLGKQIHGEEGQPAPAWMRPWHQQHGWAWSSVEGDPTRGGS